VKRREAPDFALQPIYDDRTSPEESIDDERITWRVIDAERDRLTNAAVGGVHRIDFADLP
jgi:hypothetical protein